VDLLIARLIDGLNNGVIYGFLGLALVCVYRGTGYLNLAQGEMAMFCAYLAYSFVGWGFPVVAAIVVVVLIGAAGGAVAERVLVRPLGRHAEYSVLLVTIGIFLALNTGAGVIWGGNPLNFPTVVPNGRSDYISIVGSRLHYQQIAILVILLAVLGLLFLGIKGMEYRHEWQEGDLVIWDNCGCMHRVVPYDENSGRRMHRTTIMGEERVA